MAKGLYIGNSNAKKVNKIYLGNGTSHKVKKGYIGDASGKARLFYSSGYVWKKYNTITQLVYIWKKYSVTFPSSIVIPSRPNELFTADDTMTGFEIINNSEESIQLYDNIPYFYDPSSIVIGFDSNGNLICDSDTGQPQLVTSSGYQYYAEYKFGWIVFPYDTYHYNSYSRYEHVFTINNKPGSNIALLWYTSGVMGYTVPVEYDKTEQGTVTSTSSGTYPNNGRHTDGYWYEYRGDETQYIQGSYISDVESDNPNAYPSNGRHSDGYWYVLQPE